ncbi:MAG: hypothetical protein LBK25_09090 [Treponema sp.]|nr:hypothetical protein [Treponema sp.]
MSDTALLAGVRHRLIHRWCQPPLYPLVSVAVLPLVSDVGLTPGCLTLPLVSVAGLTPWCQTPPYPSLVSNAVLSTVGVRRRFTCWCQAPLYPLPVGVRCRLTRCWCQTPASYGVSVAALPLVSDIALPTVGVRHRLTLR